MIGVEPAGANALAMSLSKSYRVRLSAVDAFADGVAVKQVGKETFRLCQKVVDGVVLVDKSEISAAIKDVYNQTRSILDLAGAVAVAGAKAYSTRYGIKVAMVSTMPHDLPLVTPREWTRHFAISLGNTTDLRLL
ncbi:unnamed protein product [Ostreobium quekettii]|uniref:Tryptophan synthase beta chain-like PALP domain-containing protein n=1 Tax=Ostreobium quekettii TaxID=121088 RepID=A0A8S1J4M5_9CHLO|nr:unnamed protein product [Ostreobium quekettii]